MVKRRAPATVRRYVSSIGPGGSHDGVLWKWVPPGGRLQPALKKVVRSLAPNSLDLGVLRIAKSPGKIWGEPSRALRTILRNASPSVARTALRQA